MKISQPTIFKRGTKLWISVRIDGVRYRQSTGLDDTKQNIKYIETYTITQLVHEIYSGEFFNKLKQVTLDEYSRTSFKRHSKDRKLSTQKEYLSVYNKHISPLLGRKLLSEITVQDINDLKQLLIESGYSSKRINDIRLILYTILNDSVDDEIIKSNPVSRVKTVRVSPRRDNRPFSLDEIKLLIENSESQERNIISTLFFTGIRTGELIGLMWKDIDFTHETINIQRSIRKGVISTTKTTTSQRTIQIIDSLKSFLLDQYKLTGRYNSYVFLNERGNNLFDSKNLRSGFWVKLLEKCNLEYRTIYTTRHTFCSLNIQNGEDILWVSKVMGHKTLKTTMERYSKYIHSDTKRSTFFNSILS